MMLFCSYISLYSCMLLKGLSRHIKCVEMICLQQIFKLFHKMVKDLLGSCDNVIFCCWFTTKINVSMDLSRAVNQQVREAHSLWCHSRIPLSLTKWWKKQLIFTQFVFQKIFFYLFIWCILSFTFRANIASTNALCDERNVLTKCD